MGPNPTLNKKTHHKNDLKNESPMILGERVRSFRNRFCPKSATSIVGRTLDDVNEHSDILVLISGCAVCVPLLRLMPTVQPQNVLRVTNGFKSDWMPSGYRDVKVNAIVNRHLCEIQLQLGTFFSLKAGQHAVYEWARELNVSKQMEPEHLFKDLSSETMKEMISLAQQNWLGTEGILPSLHLSAGDYLQAQEILKKVYTIVVCSVLGGTVDSPPLSSSLFRFPRPSIALSLLDPVLLHLPFLGLYAHTYI